MQVHLLDATYELFRSHFGRQARRREVDAEGRPVGATVGVLETVFELLRAPGVTHLACATDHVIRSWRNERWPDYKTEAGVPQELLDQFPRAEDALRSVGVVVWPMVEFEADDALATGAARWADAPDVERVVILSPDKDMAQCVREDGRVVTYNRRVRQLVDAAAVRAKFGVSPESIPDYLALVGDSSDGFPGLPGWGARSAALVLARYGHLEQIPREASRWDVRVTSAPVLAATLRQHWDLALLFRELATLSVEVPLAESLDDLRWRGVPREEFDATVAMLGARHLYGLVPRWSGSDRATATATSRA